MINEKKNRIRQTYHLLMLSDIIIMYIRIQKIFLEKIKLSLGILRTVNYQQIIKTMIEIKHILLKNIRIFSIPIIQSILNV
jgi:hypothetical protein